MKVTCSHFNNVEETKELFGKNNLRRDFTIHVPSKAKCRPAIGVSLMSLSPLLTVRHKDLA